MKKLGEVENGYIDQYVKLWTGELHHIIESKLHTGSSKQWSVLKSKGAHVRRIRSYTKDIIYLFTSIHDDIYNSVGVTATMFSAKGQSKLASLKTKFMLAFSFSKCFTVWF